jgi:nitroimidazol reductase NimA-like FMN-containing flavoprotein (pyridoxamine 5'-phosphate oxidase superfamily)
MRTVIIRAREEMEDILSRASVCFVGICDLEGNPYVIPMNFGYSDGVVYLHSGPTGSSIDMLKQNNKACITFSVGDELVYQDIQIGCSYRVKAASVMCRGKVSFIDDMEQKRRALGILMKHYTDYAVRYSDAAVRNVCIWQVPVDSMTGRRYAVE